MTDALQTKLHISDGMHVTLAITVTDGQGELISQEGDVLEMTVGNGETFDKLEAAIMGKCVGDIAYVLLEPVDHVGEYDPDLIRVELASKFPDNVEEGMMFEGIPGEMPDANKPNAAVELFTVTDVSDDNVVLDANHPMAGMTLQFKLVIKEVGHSVSGSET